MRRAACLLLTAALLTGCGQLDPAERLQDKTAEMVDSANARDLTGLRSSIDVLRAEIEAQEATGEMTRNRAQLLLRLLAQIERDAALVNGEPAPEPTVTREPSPTPSPTRSPTPSPTPSPTAEPEPEPTSTPTPPEETASPTGVPTVELPSPTKTRGRRGA